MANRSISSAAFPILTEREREAVVARARAKLFELLRLYEVDVSDSDWPMLEEGLQVRINLSPELQRRFWCQPEKAIEELMRTPWKPAELEKLFPNEVEN